jgi:5-methylthioribose kinase
MSYQPLDEKSIPGYLRSRRKMSDIFPDEGPLSIREIGDGNLNLVFIIESADGRHSAVLKQALPYLRVAGASWPLTRERMRFESAALLKHNELAPGRVPVVYDCDEEMSAVLMEYLGRYEIMRRPLVARKRFPLFVDHITDFLARSLFFTSDLYLSGVEKKALQAQFINPHLCKIQEDFVFTNPYMESPENKWNPVLDPEVKAVRSNSRLKLAIAEVKETYMTHAQALIHSDLHTGSIMVNDTDTRVIDPEFAFFGPIGYDVGALLANFIINHVSNNAVTTRRISSGRSRRSGPSSPASSTCCGLRIREASSCRRSTGTIPAERRPSRSFGAGTSAISSSTWWAMPAARSCGA